MARARTIKPAFFKNEHLAVLPIEVQLLFIGLWTIADRDGRLEDRPMRIKGELFPYYGVDVDAGLRVLATQQDDTHPFIIRYRVGNMKCIQIVNWEKHQHPHPNENRSEIPPFEPEKHENGVTFQPMVEVLQPMVEALPTKQVPARAMSSLYLPPYHLEINTCPTSSDDCVLPTTKRVVHKKQDPEVFRRFWNAYPRREARSAAEKSFAKACTRSDPDLIISQAISFAAAKAGVETQFLPLAATWLNQSRYEDDPASWVATNGTKKHAEPLPPIRRRGSTLP